MLSKEEERFMIYWEKNRLRRKKTTRQFLLGIPAGLLIVVPIVINLGSGWYRRANMEANSEDFNPMVLFVALLLIVGFTAIFWQKHQWDQLEQRYRELQARRTKKTPPAPETAAAPQKENPLDPEPAGPTAEVRDAVKASETIAPAQEAPDSSAAKEVSPAPPPAPKE